MLWINSEGKMNASPPSPNELFIVGPIILLGVNLGLLKNVYSQMCNARYKLENKRDDSPNSPVYIKAEWVSNISEDLTQNLKATTSSSSVIF
mmetsp:Transcript_13392/g.19732  ORF Transcript_13392/g.19732 Transcript_13392/m.19732 type:complete len:92 (+) Transcript_13392:3968-4243(+)